VQPRPERSPRPQSRAGRSVGRTSAAPQKGGPRADRRADALASCAPLLPCASSSLDRYRGAEPLLRSQLLTEEGFDLDWIETIASRDRPQGQLSTAREPTVDERPRRATGHAEERPLDAGPKLLDQVGDGLHLGADASLQRSLVVAVGIVDHVDHDRHERLGQAGLPLSLPRLVDEERSVGRPGRAWIDTGDGLVDVLRDRPGDHPLRTLYFPGGWPASRLVASLPRISIGERRPESGDVRFRARNERRGVNPDPRRLGRQRVQNPLGPEILGRGDVCARHPRAVRKDLDIALVWHTSLEGPRRPLNRVHEPDRLAGRPNRAGLDAGRRGSERLGDPSINDASRPGPPPTAALGEPGVELRLSHRLAAGALLRFYRLAAGALRLFLPGLARSQKAADPAGDPCGERLAHTTPAGVDRCNVEGIRHRNSCIPAASATSWKPPRSLMEGACLCVGSPISS